MPTPDHGSDLDIQSTNTQSAKEDSKPPEYPLHGEISTLSEGIDKVESHLNDLIGRLAPVLGELESSSLSGETDRAKGSCEVGERILSLNDRVGTLARYLTNTLECLKV